MRTISARQDLRGRSSLAESWRSSEFLVIATAFMEHRRSGTTQTVNKTKTHSEESPRPTPTLWRASWRHPEGCARTQIRLLTKRPEDPNGWSLRARRVGSTTEMPLRNKKKGELETVTGICTKDRNLRLGAGTGAGCGNIGDWTRKSVLGMKLSCERPNSHSGWIANRSRAARRTMRHAYPGLSSADIAFR